MSNGKDKILKKRRCRLDRFLATPVWGNKVHWFEAEYEEIAPGVWKKVYGTEKDLGPADVKKNKKS